MNANEQTAKAVVHVSGTLLRSAWWGKELNSCIVVRPSGKERDTVGYVVNQVKFEGPSQMVFSTKPRETPRDRRDLCAPNRSERTNPQETDAMQGFVGALPGFDNAIMVYLEVEEAFILVQPKQGDKFIPFLEFRHLVGAKKITVPTLNPMLEAHC